MNISTEMVKKGGCSLGCVISLIGFFVRRDDFTQPGPMYWTISVYMNTSTSRASRILMMLRVIRSQLLAFLGINAVRIAEGNGGVDAVRIPSQRQETVRKPNSRKRAFAPLNVSDKLSVITGRL